MNTRVIVLAAGKGTRMQGEVPKPIVPFKGKPLGRHLIDSIQRSGVDTRPVVVVGHRASEVKEALGDDVDYVLQEKQLGTGHAVLSCREALEGKAARIMVLYSDHPFVQPDTVRKLAQASRETHPAIVMATAVVPDFEGWREACYDFGRIVRDASGNIARIVEKKDATQEELSLREVNPAFFNFDASWLWSTLPLIKNENKNGEYYLTDLPAFAIAAGLDVLPYPIDPSEVLGVNTLEHLTRAATIPEIAPCV